MLAVAGIGNPRPFVRYLKSFSFRVKVNIFPDHHNYSRKDIELLRKRYNEMRGDTKIIITTEKESRRPRCNPYFPHELKAVTFYLPIEVEFVPNGAGAGSESFADAIRQVIRDNTQG